MDSEPMLSVLSVMSRLSAADVDVFIPSELHSSNMYFVDVLLKSITVTYQLDLEHFE